MSSGVRFQTMDSSNGYTYFYSIIHHSIWAQIFMDSFIFRTSLAASPPPAHNVYHFKHSSSSPHYEMWQLLASKLVLTRHSDLYRGSYIERSRVRVSAGASKYHILYRKWHSATTDDTNIPSRKSPLKEPHENHSGTTSLVANKILKEMKHPKYYSFWWDASKPIFT